MKKKFGSIIILLLITVNIFSMNGIPFSDCPWTIQFAAGNVNDDFLNEINTVLQSLDFPMLSMSGNYYYTSRGLKDGEMYNRYNAGGFETRSEANKYAQLLENDGYSTWVRKNFNITLGKSGSVTITDEEVILGTGERYTIESGFSERAYIQPMGDYIVFVNQNGMGYESEGETMFLVHVPDGEERLVLISYNMVQPKVWGTLPNGNPGLIVEFENGATGFSSYIVLMDIITGEFIQTIFQSTVVNVLPNGIEYETYSDDGGSNVIKTGSLNF